jgi:hypothetical protein
MFIYLSYSFIVIDSFLAPLGSFLLPFYLLCLKDSVSAIPPSQPEMAYSLAMQCCTTRT